MEVTDIGKHSSLLWHGNNYGYKKFFSVSLFIKLFVVLKAAELK